MPDNVSRRQWLTGAAAAVAGVALAPSLVRAQAVTAPRRRVLRAAHITDVHVEPGISESGFAQALHHLQSQADKPELILNTGDCIMDSYKRGEAATQKQWRVWQTILQNECSLPLVHCLGNHDVWGGDKTASGTTGAEPRWGKRWALEALGLERAYRSFDRFGWHFVVLDGTTVTDHGYRARLDDTQFGWLVDDLQAVPAETPVLIMTHEPILSVAALFDGKKVQNDIDHWDLGGAALHTDALRLKDLFYRRGNVKVCLTGHIHMLDRVDYLGTSHICCGAVSGDKWNPQHPARQECQPGYGLLDLFSDGTFDYNYQVYGWRPTTA
jgi:3',5'-cyclic AMP phosphodiesterase CpdA